MRAEHCARCRAELPDCCTMPCCTQPGVWRPNSLLDHSDQTSMHIIHKGGCSTQIASHEIRDCDGRLRYIHSQRVVCSGLRCAVYVQTCLRSRASGQESVRHLISDRASSVLGTARISCHLAKLFSA